MESLKVTAWMQSAIAVFDDWSPSLEGLLVRQILDDRALLSANPSAADVNAVDAVVKDNMPVSIGDLWGQWYWQISAPCYTYKCDQVSNFRKRWEPGFDSPNPNWGKRKPKWRSGEGAEKSYDVPNYLRLTDSIVWYVAGDRAELSRLLSQYSNIGKKQAHGHGQISRWTVEPFPADWHLWGPNKELMRPIPNQHEDICKLMDDGLPFDFALRDWGWRSPAWLPDNKTTCLMPVHTVRRHG